MTFTKSRIFFLLTAAFILPPAAAHAHGRAGDRVFPATLAIDDPAVSDELTAPQVNSFREREDGGPAQWNTETAFEYSKRITDKFALSVEGGYDARQHESNGFGGVGVGAKYQLLTNAAHETIISAGIDADLGHTGRKGVGDAHTSLTPAIFFGKGFGDLPDSMDKLKPLAITGTAGWEHPTGGDEPDAAVYGLTLQYSLPYLQQHVRDVGLSGPLKNVTPLVEFSFATPVEHGEHTTTGTINPGFIWSGSSTQFGVEAIVPMNNATGRGVGFRAQMHFYLDDIFPTTLGKPVF